MLREGQAGRARLPGRGGGEFLAETAIAAVAAAEAAGGNSGGKFDAAKSIVVTALEAKGVPLVLNAIHGAIEGAVEGAVADMNADKA